LITLYHGNALRIMDELEPGSFDAIITDPPYSSGGASIRETAEVPSIKYTNKKKRCPFPDFDGETMDQRTWTGFITETLEKARRLCKPGAVCAMFSDWRQYPSATDAFQRAGWRWRGTVIWDKMNSRPQKGRFKQQAEFIIWGSNGRLPINRPVPVLPGVFAHAIVQGKERLHMTQKPLELMRALVKISVPGGKILDPFAGSGSTLEAARLEGYNVVGIEVNREIAETAAGRLGINISF
jgi:site-specific DNA-methyltransferase (adenine-specific)